MKWWASEVSAEEFNRLYSGPQIHAASGTPVYTIHAEVEGIVGMPA